MSTKSCEVKCKTHFKTLQNNRTWKGPVGPVQVVCIWRLEQMMCSLAIHHRTQANLLVSGDELVSWCRRPVLSVLDAELPLMSSTWSLHIMTRRWNKGHGEFVLKGQLTWASVSFIKGDKMGEKSSWWNVNRCPRLMKALNTVSPCCPPSVQW